MHSDNRPPCAATEEMLIMRPHRRARIAGGAACVTRKQEVRFPARDLFQSASVTFSIFRTVERPALFTSMSIDPRERSTIVIIRLTSPERDTSALTAIVRRLDPAMALRVRSASSRRSW
jgi:hypothetical protein